MSRKTAVEWAELLTFSEYDVDEGEHIWLSTEQIKATCAGIVERAMNEAAAEARRTALQDVIVKIRAICTVCGGEGVYETGEISGGWPKLAQCEYCGRPTDAIQSLLNNTPHTGDSGEVKP